MTRTKFTATLRRQKAPHLDPSIAANVDERLISICTKTVQRAFLHAVRLARASNAFLLLLHESLRGEALDGPIVEWHNGPALALWNERVDLARWANEAGMSSRRAGAPILRPDCDREVVLRWLQWNDPNGDYLDEEKPDAWDDEDGEFPWRPDRDPLTEDEAWEHLKEALVNA